MFFLSRIDKTDEAVFEVIFIRMPRVSPAPGWRAQELRHFSPGQGQVNFIQDGMKVGKGGLSFAVLRREEAHETDACFRVFVAG